jgi:hypothetical protein
VSAKTTIALLDQVKAAVKADALEALPKVVFITFDSDGEIEGAYEQHAAASGAQARMGSYAYPIREVTLHPSIARLGI